MIELIGCFAGGFIVFFIALVRYSGDHRHFSREAPRTAPVLFAVFWLVSVVALAVIAIETVFAPDQFDLGGLARISALCLGFTAGHVTYRLWLRRRRDAESNASQQHAVADARAGKRGR
jgi:hypothetical protein